MPAKLPSVASKIAPVADKNLRDVWHEQRRVSGQTTNSLIAPGLQ